MDDLADEAGPEFNPSRSPGSRYELFRRTYAIIKLNVDMNTLFSSGNWCIPNFQHPSSFPGIL